MSIVAPWHVETFGRLRLVQGERVISRFRTRQEALLLAYLAINAGRSYSRDHLIELLWPESDIDSGRSLLRTTLYLLRRVLEPVGAPAGAVLIADRQNVRLEERALRVDVHDFDAAVRRARSTGTLQQETDHLRAAVGLYTGELLPGFYEEWVNDQRHRLDDAFGSALAKLVESLIELNSYEEAIEYAHQLIALDRLNEASHSALIRGYAGLGRIDDAKQQYRELRRLLKEELGVAPSTELRDYVQSLRADATRPSPASSIRPARELETEESPSSPKFEPRLPVTLTRFFGREEDLQFLAARIMPAIHESGDSRGGPEGDEAPRVRLITLTGAGGSGKTRLAVEAARRAVPAFDGAVWFVPLADLGDPRSVPGAILEALPVSSNNQAEPLEQVVSFFRQPGAAASALLVLDNLEQLLAPETGRFDERNLKPPDAAAIIHRILSEAPAVSVLATSRIPLEISGEREYPVMSLRVVDVEKMSGDVCVTDVAENPAVALFVDRAQAVNPGFALTDRNSDAVCAVCRQLDGIPLAIEMAAARARALTPAQMTRELETSVDLLVNRNRNAEERHRTLRAAIEWSYRLLPQQLRKFFARLSVFRGGWTSEAAAAVCLPPAEDEVSIDRTLEAIDLLNQLVIHSLVLAEDAGGGMRYRMLETIRAYAADQLNELDREAMSRSHAEYFLQVARESEKGLLGQDQPEWVNRLRQEHANIREVLRWGMTSGEDCAQKVDPDVNRTRVAADFAGHLCRFWYYDGHYREARSIAGQLLEHPGLPNDDKAIRARLLIVLGIMADQMGNLDEAKARYQASLELAREVGDPGPIARALTDLACIEVYRAEFLSARPRQEEALRLWEKLGDEPNCAVVKTQLAIIAKSCGDSFGAKELYSELRDYYLQSGNRRNLAWMLIQIGEIVHQEGDFESAEQYYCDAEKLFEERADREGLSCLKLRQGELAMDRNDFARARAILSDSLDGARELGLSIMQGCILAMMASAERREGKGIQRSWPLFVEALQLLSDGGMIADLPQVLSELSIDIAGAGLWREFVVLFSAVDTFRSETGLAIPERFVAEAATICDRIRAEIGQAAFDAEWARGQQIGLTEAVNISISVCRSKCSR